jgi:hypothetical protein
MTTPNEHATALICAASPLSKSMQKEVYATGDEWRILTSISRTIRCGKVVVANQVFSVGGHDPPQTNILDLKTA